MFFLYSSNCKIILSVGYTLDAIFYGSQSLTHVENEPHSSSESAVQIRNDITVLYTGVLISP